MTIKIIAVGKMKEKFFIDACGEYKKRLSLYGKVEEKELPEGGGLEKEAALIKNEIPKGAYVIAMCIEGKKMSSPALASDINRAFTGGFSAICIILGSSEGMSDEIKRGASLCLSMSDMTFPHHLARVMVYEQIYRSMNILAGGKYHK